MGGPGGYRTMTEEEMHELFGNEDPFSDFFQTFFRRRRWRARDRDAAAAGGRAAARRGATSSTRSS